MIPNLHQVARSNLVQLKKNKTMQWLHSLPDEQQIQVIDLAVESRQAVQKECKHEEQQRAIVRRQNMAQAHIRREAVKQKAQQERNQLSQQHLITSSDELYQAILDIDKKCISATKKAALKRSLVSTQMKIKKKVLGQNIHIIFSHLRKLRPVNEIVKELSEHIERNSTEFSEFFQDPASLIGRYISHKFETEETREVKWYHGTVVGYDMVAKTHEIIYEDEEEHCHFDLTLDMFNGDIKLVT